MHVLHALPGLPTHSPTDPPARLATQDSQAGELRVEGVVVIGDTGGVVNWVELVSVGLGFSV